MRSPGAAARLGARGVATRSSRRARGGARASERAGGGAHRGAAKNVARGDAARAGRRGLLARGRAGRRSRLARCGGAQHGYGRSSPTPARRRRRPDGATRGSAEVKTSMPPRASRADARWPDAPAGVDGGDREVAANRRATSTEASTIASAVGARVDAVAGEIARRERRALHRAAARPRALAARALPAAPRSCRRRRARAGARGHSGGALRQLRRRTRRSTPSRAASRSRAACQTARTTHPPFLYDAGATRASRVVLADGLRSSAIEQRRDRMGRARRASRRCSRSPDAPARVSAPEQAVEEGERRRGRRRRGGAGGWRAAYEPSGRATPERRDARRRVERRTRARSEHRRSTCRTVRSRVDGARGRERRASNL